MNTVFFCALLSLATATMAGAQAPRMSNAPKLVQTLAAGIKGKNPEQVLAILVGQLGPPTRDTGSGLSIPQWDMSDGVLTFHPLTGPVFFEPKTKTHFRLLQTRNRVAANILGAYEMATLPNAAGGSFHLGRLEFRPNSTYQFTDSGQHPGQRSAQAENFFMLHPTGTVEVRYPAPVKPDTLLESLSEGAIVAKLIFTSANGKHQAAHLIASSERARRLHFAADTPLPFQMSASWANFWH
ncbi:MAG: hypothetical protein JNM76_04725 [Betaproteobacteria bacterium]|nr:hypothetical protein [Betaproteobacteria bacterium]